MQCCHIVAKSLLCIESGRCLTICHPIRVNFEVSFTKALFNETNLRKSWHFMAMATTTTIDLFTERKACWENGGDLEILTPRSFEFRQVVRSLFSKQTSLSFLSQEHSNELFDVNCYRGSILHTSYINTGQRLTIGHNLIKITQF